MEDWITIRNLKSKPGAPSNREIARLLGISHNTVKKALENDTGPAYSRLPVENPDIEPFKEYIERRYVKDELQKSRVLREIQSKGFKGSKSAFYRYISKLKPVEVKTFHPYETEPGEQAQFDWSPYTIVINTVLTKVYVYSYILGFSRYRVYEASLSQTLASVLDALENSMIESGGAPERIQTDNAGCFIINASRDNLQWNPRYLQYCGHYSMKPTRSLPRHPWSKGKVERPFDFLEEQFIKGNEFDSFEDFYKRLKAFQEEVNARVHSTTKQKPKDLFNKELDSLRPLPSTRFVDVKEEVRKVTADCLISFQGSRYSVPYHFATKEVWLKVTKGYMLQVYSSQNRLIAEHVLSAVKGKVIMKDEHYKEHSIERGNWERLSQSFLQTFPNGQWFLDKLKAQKKINPRHHLTKILDLSKYYQKDDMSQAFLFCEKYNAYSIKFIQCYLDNHSKVEKLVPQPIEQNLLKAIATVEIKRPLSEYKISNYQ